VNEKITAANPNLLNQLAEQAMAEGKPQEPIFSEITYPSDSMVFLPGGYITATGEVIKTAEVRELTGKDEEYMGKSPTLSKAFNGLLERAVVSIGDMPVTSEMIDQLLVGDRDALLLGIYKVTFGSEAELEGFCNGCSEYKPVQIDIDEDIEVTTLANPIDDRKFTVKGKKHSYLISLPDGTTQKHLVNNSDKTVAELTTLLLEQTVLEIDETPVLSKLQAQSINLADRRKIGEELAKRAPGPKFNNIEVDCPDCEGKVVVPINIGALFRF
jgi:hypothetical protein